MLLLLFLGSFWKSLGYFFNPTSDHTDFDLVKQNQRHKFNSVDVPKNISSLSLNETCILRWRLRNSRKLLLWDKIDREVRSCHYLFC